MLAHKFTNNHSDTLGSVIVEWKRRVGTIAYPALPLVFPGTLANCTYNSKCFSHHTAMDATV